MGVTIRIFGGTFDPPHLGHLAAAQEALERCGLERVLFVPSESNPLKQDEQKSPTEHRLAMTQLAIADDQQLRLAQLRPGALRRLLLDRHERGELDEEERELALAPVLAPVADHRRQQGLVFMGAPGVRFALVPDRAADRIGNQRGDHAVVEVRRAAAASGWI